MQVQELSERCPRVPERVGVFGSLGQLASLVGVGVSAGAPAVDLVQGPDDEPVELGEVDGTADALAAELVQEPSGEPVESSEVHDSADALAECLLLEPGGELVNELAVRPVD